MKATLALVFIELVMVIWTLGTIAWVNYVSPLFKKPYLIDISRIMTWTITCMLCVHLTAMVAQIIVGIVYS